MTTRRRSKANNLLSSFEHCQSRAVMYNSGGCKVSKFFVQRELYSNDQDQVWKKIGTISEIFRVRVSG
jgi:hypothetical protein